MGTCILMSFILGDWLTGEFDKFKLLQHKTLSTPIAMKAP